MRSKITKFVDGGYCGYDTVKDLKALLQRFPDKLPLCLSYHSEDCSREICFAVSYVGLGVTFLGTKVLFIKPLRDADLKREWDYFKSRKDFPIGVVKNDKEFIKRHLRVRNLTVGDLKARLEKFPEELGIWATAYNENTQLTHDTFDETRFSLSWVGLDSLKDGRKALFFKALSPTDLKRNADFVRRNSC